MVLYLIDELWYFITDMLADRILLPTFTHCPAEETQRQDKISAYTWLKLTHMHKVALATLSFLDHRITHFSAWHRALCSIGKAFALCVCSPADICTLSAAPALLQTHMWSAASWLSDSAGSIPDCFPNPSHNIGVTSVLTLAYLICAQSQDSNM